MKVVDTSPATGEDIWQSGGGESEDEEVQAADRVQLQDTETTGSSGDGGGSGGRDGSAHSDQVCFLHHTDHPNCLPQHLLLLICKLWWWWQRRQQSSERLWLSL